MRATTNGLVVNQCWSTFNPKSTRSSACNIRQILATGSYRGSTAGDFRAAGCPLIRAGKMQQREENGLALVRAMLQAAGRTSETPWLLWTKACEGLMATWPTLPRHQRDVERIADGCANHSLDAVRYGVQWWRSKWKTGRGPNIPGW